MRLRRLYPKKTPHTHFSYARINWQNVYYFLSSFVPVCRAWKRTNLFLWRKISSLHSLLGSVQPKMRFISTHILCMYACKCLINGCCMLAAWCDHITTTNCQPMTLFDEKVKNALLHHFRYPCILSWVRPSNTSGEGVQEFVKMSLESSATYD